MPFVFSKKSKRTILQIKLRKSIYIRCGKQQTELLFVYYFLNLNKIIQSKRILVLSPHTPKMRAAMRYFISFSFSLSLRKLKP